MRSKWSAAILCALLLAGPPAVFAASKPLELKWNELAPVVVGHRVEVTQTDGRSVKGEVAVIREDALVLDKASLPRDSVLLIKVEKTRGSWGRSMGTVLGVLSGVVGGAYAAYVGADSAGTGIPIFLGVAAGTTLAGYYLGRQVDRRVTTIKIVP